MEVPTLRPRFYDTQRWKNIRNAYIAANPICKHCHQIGIVTAAAQVDHIKPISEGGNPSSFDNLQSLCDSCHSKKTRKENQPRKKAIEQQLEYSDTITPVVKENATAIKKQRKNKR